MAVAVWGVAPQPPRVCARIRPTGHKPVVAALLASGRVDVDGTIEGTERGERTAVEYAMDNRNWAVVEMLMAAQEAADTLVATVSKNASEVSLASAETRSPPPPRAAAAEPVPAR